MLWKRIPQPRQRSIAISRSCISLRVFRKTEYYSALSDEYLYANAQKMTASG